MPKTVNENRIFAAALELLISHGFEGATTQKIAAAAGVNEVTLFRRYGSKAHLIATAVQHQLADAPLLRVAYSGDLEADLVEIVEAYVQTNALYGDIIPVLLVEMPRHRDLRRALDAPWQNIQTIIRILRRYQRRGLLQTETPLAALGALIGPILVSQMLRRANTDLPVPAIDARSHVAAYLHGRRLVPGAGASPRQRGSRAV